MKIYFSPLAGIGNRIKGLINELRKNIDEQLYISWPLSEVMGANFSQLFNMKNIIEDTISDNPPQVTNWRLEVPNALIDLEYENIHPKYKKLFLPVFQKIKFHKTIIEKAERYSPPKVGVHYREDAVWNRARRSIPIEKYFDVIDTIDKSISIFLIAHSSKAIELFKNRYGDRIYFLDKERPSVSIQSFKDVCSELLILSKCKTIIGDSKSTFPEVAWWLGDCKAKVITVSKNS